MSKARKKKKIVRPQYISKEQRAKQAPKKPMAKEKKLAIIFCSAALVIAIILFAVFYDDGSLPVQDGNVVMEDNWVVANKGTNSEPKYYKVGEVAPMDGFVPDNADDSGTSLIMHTYVPEDEAGSRVSNYYVTGLGSKPDESVQSAHENFALFYADMEIGDVQVSDTHGHEFHYFITKMLPAAEAEAEAADEPAAEADADAGDAQDTPADDEPADDPAVEDDTADTGESEEDAPAEEPETPAEETVTTQLTQQLIAYIPAKRDTSILFSVTVPYSEENPALTEEELLAIADEIVHSITVDE